MEKQEALDCFIASSESVEEDLKQWEEGIPSDEEVRDEWLYFQELLQLAKDFGIDKDTRVSEHARTCMTAFIKLVPELAQATN